MNQRVLIETHFTKTRKMMIDPDAEETVEELNHQMLDRGATHVELEFDERLGVHELWFELEGRRRQARGYSKVDAYYAALAYVSVAKGSQRE